jgi:DNA invertase Pin-like site-specific DNA recombinase
MLIGYARVSTKDQSLALQRSALKGVGCKRIYEEKVSGAKRARPELARMLDQLRAGDVVVVSRLDQMARSMRDLLEIAEQLKEVCKYFSPARTGRSLGKIQQSHEVYPKWLRHRVLPPI